MDYRKSTSDYTAGSRAGLYAIPQVFLYSGNLDLAGNVASIIIFLSLLIPRISFRVCHNKVHKIITIFSLLSFVVVGNLTNSPEDNFWTTMHLPYIGILDVVYFVICLAILFTILHSFDVSEIDPSNDSD